MTGIQTCALPIWAGKTKPDACSSSWQAVEQHWRPGGGRANNEKKEMNASKI